MFEKVVKDDPSSLQYVPDWFVTGEWACMWYDKSDYWADDENNKFFKWYDGYKKRKAQKAKLKEELMRVVWHPSRWWDWCVPEDEKKETEKLWS